MKTGTELPLEVRRRTNSRALVVISYIENELLRENSRDFMLLFLLYKLKIRSYQVIESP